MTKRKDTKTTKRRAGQPLLFATPEELQTKIDAYLKSRWDYKRNSSGERIKDEDGSDIMIQTKPYTIGSLAVFLNCDRDTLVNYGKKEEFFGTIKKIKNIIYGYAEDCLYSSKNQAGIIFSMKNNYGWKDKTEIDMTSRNKNPDFEDLKDSELLEKARKMYGGRPSLN